MAKENKLQSFQSLIIKNPVIKGCAGTTCMGPNGDPANCPYKASCPVYKKWLLKNNKEE